MSPRLKLELIDPARDPARAEAVQQELQTADSTRPKTA